MATAKVADFGARSIINDRFVAWYDYQARNTHVLSLAGRHETTLRVDALQNAPTYALCGSSLLFSPGGPYAHTIQSVALPG